jgi:cyclopropane fatty-acyl-phospholipid synthase-like methyltransferase
MNIAVRRSIQRNPAVFHRMTSTKSHYEGHSAETYESAFFYEPGAYTEHLKHLVKRSLQLDASLDGGAKDKDKCLLDIGGGTGNFTQMIVEDAPNVRAIVVDPFLEQQSEDESAAKDKRIRFVKAPAEEFKLAPTDENIWWRRDYHQVLLKEVVHHFQDSDRVPIFKGIFDGLGRSDAPSLLIVTRPKRGIDYPLWDEAREVWAKNQPSLEQFVDELEQAGFSDVQHSLESYPCTVLLERWQSMVKSRFWSTFSNFTDKELDDACHRIAEDEKERIDKDGLLHFEDRLLFITARK